MVGGAQPMTSGYSGRGRPRKSAGPRVPYEEVDRILVFGEVVPCEDGNGTTVCYPSYRELAERYGVSNSVIAEYAKSHNVQRRRKEAQTRIQVKAEQKLVEMRAKAIAVSKDDELRIIDTYLLGFAEALQDKRVRFDNAADFNTMVRLKEFVLGNADSRQEIHAALSLETLQDRHRRMMRTLDTTAEERGEVENAVPGNGDTEKALPLPPASSIEGAAEETSGRFPGRFEPKWTKSSKLDEVNGGARARTKATSAARIEESDQAAVVVASGHEVGPGCDEAPRATILSSKACRAAVGPNRGPHRGTRGEGEPRSHDEPHHDATSSVVLGACQETARVCSSSAEMGDSEDSAGFSTMRPTAEQTAGPEETHGPPTVPDFGPGDELADTLPPPPPGPEGPCE